jgi:hypothetical protein
LLYLLLLRPRFGSEILCTRSLLLLLMPLLLLRPGATRGRAGCWLATLEAVRGFHGGALGIGSGLFFTSPSCFCRASLRCSFASRLALRARQSSGC